MRRRIWFSIIGVIAVAAIAIGINMFADARLANVHVDLTHGHIYTLSDGTRQILAGLKEPITLRLFYSRRLGSTVPVLRRLRRPRARDARRICRDLRRQGQAGILRSRAVQRYRGSRDGIRPAGRAARSRRRRRSISALPAATCEDDERTIAFFQPERERFLEYDLTKLVYELSNPKRPVIGVMSSLPLDGDPRAMMMAMRGQRRRAASPMPRRCCCGRPTR